MADGITLSSGYDETLGLLKSLDDFSFANRVLMAGGQAIQRRMATYPRSRSVPGRVSLKTHKPMGYYKRGTGWFYPIMRKGKVRGYRNTHATSETLGRRWAISSRGPLTVVVGNNASYGPWVQSATKLGDGRGPQARVHTATGWKTDQQVLNEEGKNIVANMEREFQKRFGG
ncbi:MAG TPA: hypothetical protein VFD70_18665 [Anaerolineae bacterium]|nr:hypothetical protein [Anaerolineae bacterium]